MHSPTARSLSLRDNLMVAPTAIYVTQPSATPPRVPMPSPTAIGPRAARVAKRGMDVAGATVALMLFSPVLAWTALTVLVTEGRPILFRQERPGLGGKPFTIIKFRTMRTPRPGEVYYLTDDERITRLGRFLRSTSLDELPELWNVVRGEMSLVGPRPLLMEYLEQYSPIERRRHEVRPGMTGWAVVNGRNMLIFNDRLSLDVWYVDNWSLLLDFRIMARTIVQVIRRQGVTATEDLSLGFRFPDLDGGHEALPVANDPAGSGVHEPQASS
jgi:sugar transferase EpsL